MIAPDEFKFYHIKKISFISKLKQLHLKKNKFGIFD